jgi:poly(3-hydroxyalkanoate) depolymerase
MVEIGGQRLRVGLRPGDTKRPPLLVFNGLGANIELTEPFLDALPEFAVILFDVPGVGGSPPTVLPYRPWHIAWLAARLLDHFGHDQADVLGISWGGGMAQQFAFQFATRTRRLVLAATSPGHAMVPGKPSVLWKMLSPSRYLKRDYLHEVAPEIYGGAFRRDTARLVHKHLRHLQWSNEWGYILQLLAIWGWSSMPWLHTLRSPTLVMTGHDDPIVPLINAMILKWLIPNARLEILDCGHLFLVTRPEESAAIIGRFLAEAP